MPQLKKMSEFHGKPMPHLGKILERLLAEKRISKTQLADKLGLTGSSINKYTMQSTIHAAMLWKMGEILDYDFFAFLSSEFPCKKTVISDREKVLEQQVTELEQKITDLKKENDLYQKILIGKAGQ